MTRDMVAPDQARLVDEAERVLYAGVSEADLARQVRGLAVLFGYRYYHSFLSVRSDPGFPDVILVRGGDRADGAAGRVLFAELKARRGRVTPAQLAWLQTLASCAGVECYLWRPEDLPEIAVLLQHGPTPELRCVRRLQELLLGLPGLAPRAARVPGSRELAQAAAEGGA